jgi:hypothetical protein
VVNLNAKRDLPGLSTCSSTLSFAIIQPANPD